MLMTVKKYLVLIALAIGLVVIVTMLVGQSEDSSLDNKIVSTANNALKQNSNDKQEPTPTLEIETQTNKTELGLSNSIVKAQPSQTVAKQTDDPLALASKYQEEIVDINWAQDQEAEIIRYLQEFSVNNPDLILNAVECRSTLCELQFFSYNEKGQINYNTIKNLAEYFPWASEFSAKMSEQGAAAVMYIEKKKANDNSDNR